MKKLRGAIVGFGKVAAEAHVPGFSRSPGFEIVAVVDPSEAQRARARELLPKVRGYADLAAAIEGEGKLDFADIAAPPKYHAPSAIAALERNVHVLCEKPLALDWSEIGELRRAARRSGHALFAVHNWKYAPLFGRLRGLLRGGAIGEVATIDWQVMRPNPPQGATDAGWRLDRAQAGGGILMDHGWHAFYLMLFLAGRPPRAITATLGHDLGFEVENDARCEIDFGGGLAAKIALRWGAPARYTGGVVHGSNGAIAIEDDRLVVRVTGRDEQVTRFSPALSASSYHPEWFPALLDDFRAEIAHLDRRGKSLAEAVTVAELMAAAYASSGAAIALAAPDEDGWRST